MKLKSFTSSLRWWDGLWGGGHTCETDPTQRGWRAALSQKGSELLIVGRRGVKGCFSVVQLGDGSVDIAVYDDLTPKEVADVVNGGSRIPADEYRQTDTHGGWILPLIQELEAAQA